MRFELFRFYIAASAVVLLVVLGLLIFFFGQISTRAMLETVERQNIVFATAIAKEFTKGAKQLLGKELPAPDDIQKYQSSPVIADIDAILIDIVKGLPVVRIKVYRSDLTIYSSEHAQIGETNTSPIFMAAMNSRLPASKLSYRETFNAIGGAIRDRSIIETYVPIAGLRRDVDPASGLIVEVYTDVSDLVAGTNETRLQITASAIAILLIFYGAIALIVRYADRAVGKHGAQLQSTISELEWAKEALRASEQQLRDFAESSSDFFWEMDENLRFSGFVGPLTEITGVPKEQLIGKTREETGVPDVDPVEWDRHLRDLRERRAFSGFVHPRDLPDGRTVWLSVSGKPVFDENGAFKGYRGTCKDVTEAVVAQSDLKSSEERYREMARISSIGHFDWDERQKRLVSCSEEFARILGRTVEEQLNEFSAHDDHIAMIHEEDRHIHAATFASVAADNPSFDSVFRIVRDDGDVRYVREQGVFTFDEDGAPVRSFGTMQDVTAEMESRRSLEESENRLERAQRIAHIGDWIWDEQTQKLVSCSQELHRILGLGPDDFPEEGYTFENEISNLHPDDRDRYTAALQDYDTGIRNDPTGGTTLDVTIRVVLSDNSIRHVREVAEPVYDRQGTLVYSVGTTQDVTDVTELELQLREAQRLEALGLITGGVTHEFNNVLQAIMANIELAGLQHEKQKDPTIALRRALNAGRTGGELTGRLLTYLGKSDAAPEVVDVAAVCENIALLVGPLLGEKVKLTTRLDQSLWPIKVDRPQLETTLMNLAINAHHAMPEGGSLDFHVRNAEAGVLANRFRNQQVPREDCVFLTIADNGTGMPHDVAERAFDPFFTTKKGTKGYGLGLSMVYGFVVRQCDGAVIIESEERKGTKVHLMIPRTSEHEAAHSAPVGRPRASKPYSDGILLVEDDPVILEAISLILGELGYRSIPARNANEALKLLRSNERPPDILLTDIVMSSGPDGTALAQQVRETYPAIKIVFMSGYPASELADRGISSLNAPMLQKPFRKSELEEVLSEIHNIP